MIKENIKNLKLQLDDCIYDWYFDLLVMYIKRTMLISLVIKKTLK